MVNEAGFNSFEFVYILFVVIKRCCNLIVTIYCVVIITSQILCMGFLFFLFAAFAIWRGFIKVNTVTLVHERAVATCFQSFIDFV